MALLSEIKTLTKVLPIDLFKDPKGTDVSKRLLSYLGMDVEVISISLIENNVVPFSYTVILFYKEFEPQKSID